jgi:hypothetical protein
MLHLMVDEPDAADVLRLGTARWIIGPEPDEPGSYVLLNAQDGKPLTAPFTRDEALQFAQALVKWARE